MVTAVYFSIISDLETMGWYLSFIKTQFLLKIGPKSSLNQEQSFLSIIGEVLARVFKTGTFHCEELQNSRKSFYGKQTWDYRISCLKCQ